MTRRPRPLVALMLSVALAAGLAACGGDDEGDQTEVTTETSTPGEKTDGAPRTLKARLSGDEEVPGPGVENGVGAAMVDITGTRACYDLNATIGEQPTAAHIHEGAAGTSGPVVVDLEPMFEPGESAFVAESCIDLPADVAARLLADPAGYYVNVHTEAHPNGAIRGQLEKA